MMSHFYKFYKAQSINSNFEKAHNKQILWANWQWQGLNYNCLFSSPSRFANP